MIIRRGPTPTEFRPAENSKDGFYARNDVFYGPKVPQVGPGLAANSSAQLKERHSDDQRVSGKSRDEFHN